MIGKAIYDILSSDGTVSGYVSTRVYPDTVPQNADFPYIAYSVSSTIPTNAKDGVSRMDETSIQVDIYSRDYSDTQAIAAAARSALDRYSGTNNGVQINSVVFANESSGVYEQQIGVYWITQDYNIRVNR